MTWQFCSSWLFRIYDRVILIYIQILWFRDNCKCFLKVHVLRDFLCIWYWNFVINAFRKVCFYVKNCVREWYFHVWHKMLILFHHLSKLLWFNEDNTFLRKGDISFHFYAFFFYKVFHVSHNFPFLFWQRKKDHLHKKEAKFTIFYHIHFTKKFSNSLSCS